MVVQGTIPPALNFGTGFSVQRLWLLLFALLEDSEYTFDEAVFAEKMFTQSFKDE